MSSLGSTQSANHKRVVVTGIGMVSGYGIGKDEFWSALCEGRSAIKSWMPEGLEDYPVKYAAPVDLPINELKQRFSELFQEDAYIERRAVFSQIAAQLAVKDAGLLSQDKNTLGENLGISVCSGVPEPDDKVFLNLAEKQPEEALNYLIQNRNEIASLHSGMRCSNDVLANNLATQFDVDGPVMNVNGACAGATQAIGLAYKAIRRGEVDKMLAGGGDSVLNIQTLSALYLLGATSTTTRWGDKLCRPFDSGRSGLVAGEGGCMLMLESEEHALARNATIYGEIVGYGSSLDAYKVTAPHPLGDGALASMSSALRSARLSPEDIDYINAHGTSTPLNDVVESGAIRRLFGDHCDNGLMVSSSKSMMGHWIAAAGAPEAAATLLAIKYGSVPPTINLDQPDPNCSLDYVSDGMRKAPLQYCLSNSFGFGGLNSTLAIGRYNTHG